MNILLIALDTQRADHLSCYGYCRHTSPTLDRLAGEGVLFENCMTHTAHTMPTFTTMMTGQDPATHGIVGTLYAHPNEPDQRLNDRTPVLAEVFRKAGWLTAAFDNLADFGCFPNWFVRGYHWYVNTWAPQGAHPSHAVAADINARLLPWLETHAKEEPWFLFVHYWDPHQPYNQPEPYRTIHRGSPQPEEMEVDGRSYRPRWGWSDRLADKSLERIDLYNGELTYVDAAVAQVLDVVRRRGVYHETTVIVTADHGEDMEEHNAPFEHREPYETTVHVPLIVKPAASLGWPAGRRVKGIVGLMDLMPSILEMAALEPPQGMDGTSWVRMAQGGVESTHEWLPLTGGSIKQHGRWVTPELGIRTQTHKYIRRGTAVFHEGQTWFDISVLCAPPWRSEPGRTLKERVDYFNSLPKVELYDLRSDPCETVNVAEQQPGVAEELERHLAEFVARNPERLITS